VARALLAARDAGAEEAETALAQRPLAADRVLKAGVAAVDDDVAWREQRSERVDLLVGSRAGLDHEDDRARPPQSAD
jgi:hypothetical protein